MSRLSNFNDFALTKSEMKGIRGGGCAVCSQGPGGGGTCGGYDYSLNDATALKNEFNSNNPDPSNPYYYYVHCQ